MKPSPVQLLQVFFKRVQVELDGDHLPQDMPNPLNTVFTFDGIDLRTEVGFALVDDQHEQGRLYLLELQVSVDNQPQPDQPGQRFSPYRLDVAVEGVILVPQGAEQLAPPDDLASVNGAGLLWSVAREQILALTSRMRAGPVMLPTVHFHDLKGESASPLPSTAATSPP